MGSPWGQLCSMRWCSVSPDGLYQPEKCWCGLSFCSQPEVRSQISLRLWSPRADRNLLRTAQFLLGKDAEGERRASFSRGSPNQQGHGGYWEMLPPSHFTHAWSKVSTSTQVSGDPSPAPRLWVFFLAMPHGIPPLLSLRLTLAQEAFCLLFPSSGFIHSHFECPMQTQINTEIHYWE